MPDVVASVILTGKIPRIVDAFRLEPCGVLPRLRPIKLRGDIEIDPRKQDFFKVVIEERKRLACRSNLHQHEKERLDKALKVLASSTSYGIYAEMNRHETEKQVWVRCHGLDPTFYRTRVANPEHPGEYCFPPLASLIAGAARLMLALLEKCLTDLGGTYAMEDTDSMAIVATERGGKIRCPGGRIKALSWEQVRLIAQRFGLLSPYDRTAIPGSILKIEDDNFDPCTGRQRRLYCFAISAKRYALFLLDDNGLPVLLRKGKNNKENRWSEHGLGHLLNPIDPNNDDREWIADVWLKIISEQLRIRVPDSTV